MEVLRAIFDAVDVIFGFVRQSMIDRFFGEAAFRDGVVWGWISLVVIVVFSQGIAYFWNLILKFMSPTKAPASSPGPKPVDQALGCGQGAIGLVIIAVLILLILIRPFVSTG